MSDILGRRRPLGVRRETETETHTHILNSLQPPDIDQNSDGGFSISKYLITKSFINSCNSRTNYDTDMKLGPLPKLEQRYAMTLKKV